MVNIKSLKRIVEADTAIDTRYASDIAKANVDYDKIAGPHKGLLRIPRGVRWALTPNKQVAEAAKDRSLALQAAKERFKFAKQGAVPKRDLDAARFEWAKATGPKLAAARAAGTKTTVTPASTGWSSGKKFAVGAGLTGAVLGAGLLAMQHRKNRLPEPESYNDEEE